ncbi:MAG: molecular chaperone DnaK, partial [Acidobacteria bacterium]|nr:molecular chaperone DnaK [Acidobacteriota bacterium]
LFNGGFFIPEVCRTRVADVVERWYGRRPLILENHDLDLAVAVGAAYYSYVRSTGAGLLVRGGLPRAYYLGIGGEEGKIRTVCLMPRGTEEGQTLEIDRDDLQLVANKPVSFRLYSSLTRTEDRLGEVVEFDSREEGDALHLHAPLNAVIRFGKKIEERRIPVKLGARLTEVGTLEIWGESKVSEHRWRLQFELRKQVAAQQTGRPVAVVSEEAVVRGEELISEIFRGRAGFAPEDLPGRLEQAMGLGRGSWPLSVIRRFADRMLEHSDGRRLGAAFEARWLNLCGFFLRPGFGFPGDDLRLEQARRVYAAGLQFANQVQCESEWWIFWGRVAPGLNRNQQVDLFQRISVNLLPRGGKKAPRLNSSLLREMWRTASSLELLPGQTKTDLGEALLKRVKAGDFRESELWCLARLGARQLFYGANNHVLPPSAASRWVEALASIPKAAETVASIARRTGDTARDLPPATLELVRRRLSESPETARALAIFEGEEASDQALGRIYGAELPSGLVFGEASGKA